MSEKKSIAALFVVALLLISLLIIMANPVKGAAVSDEELTPDDEIGWLSDLEEFDIEEPDEDIFVGQKDVSMTPSFTENVIEDWDDEVNITQTQILVDEVARLVGDEWQSDQDNDWLASPDTFQWTRDTIYVNTGDFSGPPDFNAETPFAGTFKFDVSNEATSGIYRFPIRMVLSNYSASLDQWYQHEDLIEYVWLEISPSVNDFTLNPGEVFKDIDVTASNFGDYDLKDVYLTLEEDDIGDDVTIHNPDNKAYVDSIDSHEQKNFNFRFTVPLGEEPGQYEVGYTLEATMMDDDEDQNDIIEHGTIMITINSVVELSAEIEENIVTQGTTKEEFTVKFTNTGNLDLERIRIKPVEDNAFSIPSDYYDGLGAEKEDPYIDIDDLNVGDSTETNIPLQLDQYMQVGLHKLSFEYEAYYYDAMGELTGTEKYYEKDHPDIPVADTSEPFAWIDVTEPDVALDIGAYNLDQVSVKDMGYQTISIDLRNHGYVDYNNVNVILHTTGTPFINPLDEDENTIDMIEDPFILDRDTEIHFGVILDTRFMEERLAEDRPIYSAGFTLEGINGDTLEEVELPFTVEGEIQGIGPQIVITSEKDENTIKAGEEFDLTFDIENIGDEPVRSLMVRASPHSSGAEELDMEYFDSAQDAIYFWQAGSPPGSYIWDVEPEDTVLYPGENTTVTLHMISSGDMQEGAIYHIDLEATGTDQGPWETTTTIRTQESASTKPIFSTQLAYVLVALIIGISFVLGIYIYKKEKKTKLEKSETKKDEKGSIDEDFIIKEENTEEIEPEPRDKTGLDKSEEPKAPTKDEIYEEESQIEPKDRDGW